MIYPERITNFNRTETEIQEFFLFSVIVAGKNALVQAQKLEQFLQPAWLKNMTPFEYIRHLNKSNQLGMMLREIKIGQYKRIEYIFKVATKLNLKTCTVDQLERIPGIGPKTSRFFLLHSRKNQKLAVLDTHILKWLKENFDFENVPRSTPQSKIRYKEFEMVFLDYAEKHGLSVAELDLSIWNKYSQKAA